MHFRWADEDPSQTDVVERMVTEAVVEHRKKITKLQKKLAAEKERRKYYGCVALLSWMITHVRRHHMCYEMQLLQRMKC